MRGSFGIFIAISVLLFSSVLIIENYKTSSLGIDNIVREYLHNEAKLILKSTQTIIKKEIKGYLVNGNCISSVDIEFDEFIVYGAIYYIGTSHCQNADKSFISTSDDILVMIDYKIESKNSVRKLQAITKREFVSISLL
jgi:hypothetical protein